MKNNYSLLALAITSILAGCSDSDESSPDTFSISGVVLDDTYKNNVEVCVDFEGIEETCTSGYTALTDSNGKFEIVVDMAEQGRLSNAKVTAKLSSSNNAFGLTEQNAENDSINYQSLLIGADSQNVIVSPFTTQVANEIALDTTKQINEASYKQASKVVVSRQNLDDSKYLFGDYLQANDQDVLELATVAKYDFEKAKLIEQEVLEEIAQDPNSPYAGWDTLNVVVSTFWQHSHHNHEFTQRVEHLIYTSRANDQGLIEDRKEGIQWYVDEYQDGMGLPLQNWYEDRNWLAEYTVSVHAFWEFDYDQDGVFKFKGEKGAEYTYVDNSSGLEQYSGYETYNEGNPAEEGAQDRGDREWVEDCPIVDELKKIETGETLDTCIDFVEFRDIETIETNKELKSLDNMTEWQAPVGTPVDVRADNQDYYEERTQIWMDDGAESYTTKHDWNAVHYHQPELPHAEPFNEIKIEGFEASGDKFTDHSTPYWANMLDRTNDLGLRGIQMYNQINIFEWRHTSNVFLQERYTEQVDGIETYSSETMRLQDESPQLYYVDSNGKPEIWSETDIEWNEESQLLDAKIKTYDRNALDLEPVVKHFLLDNFQLAGSTMFADMKINGTTEQVDRPAFTSDIFEELNEWDVIADSENEALKEVAEFIFNVGQTFSFKDYIEAGEGVTLPEGMCNADSLGGVQHILQFEKGGDMYIAIHCRNSDGHLWVNETYALHIDQVDATGSFIATLKQWEYGVNVLETPPVATATLTFQPLN